MTNEYRVEVKVKNNLIIKKIEEAGYKSISDFCHSNNKPGWKTRIGNYINLQATPLNVDGEFYPHIWEICNILVCSPEDLFTETQLQTALETNKRTLEVKEAEMRFMLENTQEIKSIEEQIFHKETLKLTNEMLDTLTPREKKVIEMRYGINGAGPLTREEVGKTFDVSSVRISQIEAKSLRKLRQRSRNQPIREHLDL